MSITSLLADEDECGVARSDRPSLTLLIRSPSAKYALINKLIQQHECSLITHNPKRSRRTLASFGAAAVRNRKRCQYVLRGALFSPASLPPGGFRRGALERKGRIYQRRERHTWRLTPVEKRLVGESYWSGGWYLKGASGLGLSGVAHWEHHLKRTLRCKCTPRLTSCQNKKGKPNRGTNNCTV